MEVLDVQDPVSFDLFPVQGPVDRRLELDPDPGSLHVFEDVRREVGAEEAGYDIRKVGGGHGVLDQYELEQSVVQTDFVFLELDDAPDGAGVAHAAEDVVSGAAEPVGPDLGPVGLEI